MAARYNAACERKNSLIFADIGTRAPSPAESSGSPWSCGLCKPRLGNGAGTPPFCVAPRGDKMASAFWPWRLPHLFQTLRFRLMMLVLLTLLPAFGLVVRSASEQRRLASIQAKENALRVARAAASSQEQSVEAEHQLLAVLAQLVAVHSSDPSAWPALLEDVLAREPNRYVGLLLVGANGRVICGAGWWRRDVDFSDHHLFRRAMDYREFALGEYRYSTEIGRDWATRSTATPCETVLGWAGSGQASTPGCHPWAQLSSPAPGLREPWDTQGDNAKALRSLAKLRRLGNNGCCVGRCRCGLSRTGLCGLRGGFPRVRITAVPCARAGWSPTSMQS